jgi:hypothetical protein
VTAAAPDPQPARRPRPWSGGFLVTPPARHLTAVSMVADGGMLLRGPRAGRQLKSDNWHAS